jgi:hypothetical protein
MYLDGSPRVLVLVRSGASKLCWTASFKVEEDDAKKPSEQSLPLEVVCPVFCEPVSQELYYYILIMLLSYLF